MDMRDNELSPPCFGEGLVANDTIRNLSNESNDNISNTVVIDKGDVVTVESSVNNTVDGNKNNSVRTVIILTRIVMCIIVIMLQLDYQVM